MTILVIRHGETEYNAQRVVQTPNVPLNERGRAQAARLARRLAGEGVGRILVSDYERARMTAAILADATAAPLDVEVLLRERNFGAVRGRPHAEIDDLYGDDFHPPGGESWEQFHARVASAWERVCHRAQQTEGDLAVVTHGLVCYSLALNQWQLPAGEQARRDFRNTSLTIVDAQSPCRVRLLNCCAHLGGAGIPSESGAGV